MFLLVSGRHVGAHTDGQPWRRYSDHFIWSMPSLSVLFFFIIVHSVFMALLFYQKLYVAKNPAILRFFFFAERTQLNAAHA